MAHPSDITYSLSRYDRDGDCIEHGVFLHFGDVSVKIADTVEEFEQIVPCMQQIIKEIKGS